MNIDNVKVGSVDIVFLFEVKILGVWFDLNLFMFVYIIRICFVIFYYFKILGKYENIL